MNLRSFARTTAYDVPTWEAAERVLVTAGFEASEIRIILSCARRNKLQPIRFARAAVQLREHIGEGLPLRGGPLESRAP